MGTKKRQARGAEKKHSQTLPPYATNYKDMSRNIGTHQNRPYLNTHKRATILSLYVFTSEIVLSCHY